MDPNRLCITCQKTENSPHFCENCNHSICSEKCHQQHLDENAEMCEQFGALWDRFLRTTKAVLRKKGGADYVRFLAYLETVEGLDQADDSTTVYAIRNNDFGVEALPENVYVKFKKEKHKIGWSGKFEDTPYKITRAFTTKNGYLYLMARAY